MPEESKYTDLLTPDELKVDALSSLGINVTDTTEVSGLGGSYQDAAILAIRDVTEAIESYLDRKLIARKHTIDIPSHKWAENDALDEMQYYPPNWPIVQIETSSVEISNDSERFLSNSKKSEVEFWAGYKRRDQSNDDFEGLDESLDDLPYDIRRVAVRLVLYELTQVKQGTIATASVTKTAGNATAEITKSREDVYADELEKLHDKRWVL